MSKIISHPFAAIGALCGALAVIIGAFGAHGLKSMAEESRISVSQLSAFETGASYHLIHAVLLTIIGIVTAGKYRNAAGLFTLFGMVLFSGSLYAYGISGITVFAMITPLGGLCYILGWLSLALYFFKKP